MEQALRYIPEIYVKLTYWEAVSNKKKKKKDRIRELRQMLPQNWLVFYCLFEGLT